MEQKETGIGNILYLIFEFLLTMIIALLKITHDHTLGEFPLMDLIFAINLIIMVFFIVYYDEEGTNFAMKLLSKVYVKITLALVYIPLTISYIMIYVKE